MPPSRKAITPPPLSDPAAEQALLGSLLINPSFFSQMVCGVEDFSSPENRIIFEAIASLHIEEEPIDLASVYSALCKTGKDKQVTPAYLAGLSENVGTVSNWRHYDQTVLDYARKRRLVALAREIEAGSRNGKKSQELLELIQAKTSDLLCRGQAPEIGITEKIKLWCENTEEEIFIQNLYKFLGVHTKLPDYRQQVNKISVILSRLVNQKFLSRSGKRGTYRLVNQELDLIDPWEEEGRPLPLFWPFGLQNYVHLYEKSIAVVAGFSNAGKTAFLLNFALYNACGPMPVIFFSSEMSAPELRKRLAAFDEPAESWKKIKWVNRSSNYADVIGPNAINIVDYLEVTDQFYMVGGEIKAIYDCLDRGIAVIAIQKNKGTDLGIGGRFGLDKPRLYLAIDPGELKIVKGKIWASERNPNGLRFKFKLVQGAKFITI